MYAGTGLQTLKDALEKLPLEERDDVGSQLISEYERRYSEAAQGKGTLVEVDSWARRQAHRLRTGANEPLFVP